MLSSPKIDKRVELVSIVFRLAGNQEYNQNNFKIYTDAIHSYFERYKDHPCVLFAREMADSSGVSFDAPASMALHLKQPPDLDPIFPFSDTVPEKRWGRENGEKFARLLKQFYTDTNSEEFFKEQENLYKLTEERFNAVFNALDVNWYKKFYGALPDGKLCIVIGVGNGGCNYGPTIIYPDGHEDAYAVMGTWSVDEKGMPLYKAGQYLPTLIHEFNHSFINRLNENNSSSLERAGQAIFTPLESIFSNQAYPNWKYMLNEAFVRAAVVRYLMSHGGDSKEETASQISNGFIWIDNLVETLDVYEKNRDKYKTLADFMPAIARFYETTANNFDSFLSKCGHVKSIEPFANNASDVSPETDKIKIIFDQPMSSEHYSIYPGPLGMDNFPLLKEGISFEDNNTALVCKMKLKPDTKYQFGFSGLRFKTKSGYPIIDYLVEFSTK